MQICFITHNLHHTNKFQHVRSFDYIVVMEGNIIIQGCGPLPVDRCGTHVYTLLLANRYSIYVHPPGGWIYYFCFFRRPMSVVRRPMSGVTHGFRSFKGKVLELLSPNLVCRLIGSVACLGLLLAVVPLLLTE